MKENIQHLQYPIGKFQTPVIIDVKQIKNWIQVLKDFPEKLKNEVQNLSDDELEKTYRPNGWTIRQVVNHCADSHLNSFIRFKLALTEQNPTIKPYAENLWADLADSKNYPIENSLLILEGLHKRWVFLLESLSETDLERTFIHPETNDEISIKTNIGIYAWHCEHHLQHIVIAKQSC